MSTSDAMADLTTPGVSYGVMTRHCPVCSTNVSLPQYREHDSQANIVLWKK